MKIMLDASPRRIMEETGRRNFEFWQLRTPLTRFSLAGVPYGLDNGCFARFEQKTWERLLDEAVMTKPVFVCLPDIVGDARRTLELFDHFKWCTENLPRALVLQNGIGDFAIPWDDIAAVFVGGSDQFKVSAEAVNAAKAARMLGKWVHVGRVNTAERVENWLALADSVDGSGISQYDRMLDQVLHAIRGDHPQMKIL